MERHFLFQVQEFHWWFSDGCFISECLVRRYQTFLCTGRNYGTSTYSVVYLVCVSDRRGVFFTGHSDLVRRFQPANPIFGQIYENVYPDRRTESLLPKWDCVGKYSFHGSCLYECDAVCRRYVLKKQIFAVCDLEAEYACNFMDYLNQKKISLLKSRLLPVWKVWWHM